MELMKKIKEKMIKMKKVKKNEDHLVEVATKFVEKKFTDLIPEMRHPYGKMHCISSCMLDTSQMEEIFTSMKDYIFMVRMGESGIVF